ncbi:NAD(P)/FAD-dependent oxidoreductase [Paenarthrobacter aromaticivorans]|uniref:FAD-dependent oxidoreductase n=1 Tax=Paenarthrobacter aromaticivorans TaxID=2849150 RepID=A0ABS6IBP4_9MICC|nr:FAD-dependent oxidoreductase [Paenarthrobacter sp. MMS21-TAE1-1]MBU8868494.1 FAD-dependent oxidoreductase [Paenarthrobacter sp. MMS21-TAE1-1]
MKYFDVLIVGGGHASAEMAANIRRLGSSVSIGIVSDEPSLPYERPPLSKAFLSGTVQSDQILLREELYWERNNVSVITAERVSAVDTESKVVQCLTGLRLGYGSLVWAAGGRARVLPVPGSEAEGVHYVRTLEGVNNLRDALQTVNDVVIIGAGYIGMETGAVLKSALKVPNVTIVESFSRVLARVTSEPVSSYLQDLHTRNGVRLLLDAGVECLTEQDGKVSGVRLSSGVTLPADVVIVGIGITPNVEELAAGGAECSNGVDTDFEGRTNLPDVWALGDCANTIVNGSRLRLESAPNVTSRAKIVAAALLGAPLPAAEPAWFWSDQFDVRIKTVGVFTGYDKLDLVGDPATGSFSVHYYLQDALIAVDTVNDSKGFAAARKLLRPSTAQKTLTA